MRRLTVRLISSSVISRNQPARIVSSMGRSARLKGPVEQGKRDLLSEFPLTVDIPSTRRPTHARIDQLQEETIKLQNFLNHLSSLPPGLASTVLARWRHSGSTDISLISDDIGDHRHDRYESQPPRQYTFSRPSSPEQSRQASPIHRLRYNRGGLVDPFFTGSFSSIDKLMFGTHRQIAAHGPTSAFFDDVVERDFGAMDPSAATVDDNELRDRATAKCAEERHMEILNLASGKLDCKRYPCSGV